MSDMTIKPAANNQPYAGAAPAAEQPAATAVAASAPAAVLNLSQGVKSALSVYNQYKAQYDPENPLSSQIKGFGTIYLRRTAYTTTLPDGSTTSGFKTSYESTYVDFATGKITSQISTSSGVYSAGNGYKLAQYESLTTSVTFNANDYQSGKLAETIDHLTASYTAKKGYLENTASGSDLTRQLDDLRNLFQTGKDEAAKSFGDMLGSFLDQPERQDFAQKVRDDIQRIFDKYEAEYQKAAATLSKADWLKISLTEITANLRKTAAASRVDNQHKDANYLTLSRLNFAAVTVAAYQSSIIKAGTGNNGSEARQALQFSMISLKVEAVSARQLISNDMADLLHLSGKNAGKQLLDALDKHFGAHNDDRLFPPADRQMFDRIVNQVVDTFRAQHNAISAVKAGAALAKPLLNNAMEHTPAQRWTEEMTPNGYWQSFNEPDSFSGIHAFAAEWQSFSLSISQYQQKISNQA